GVQSLQGGRQRGAPRVVQLPRLADAQALTQVDAARRHPGQRGQAVQPAGQIAVAEAARKIQGQALHKGGQRTRQTSDEGGVVHGFQAAFTATMEAKLKHWNQTSKLTKPAWAMRLSCSGTVSGSRTFSRAARLRLTSSSL